jgi:4'-phosphopantetheinyl transferase
MDQPKVAVHPWPVSRPLIAADSHAGPDLLVISVATPDSTLRRAARMQLRGALCEVLGLQLHRAPESILLVSTAAGAVRVESPGHRICLSLSHETGMSVAAVRRSGPVGIDIVRLPEGFDWQPVAHDYLGLRSVARIACMPPREQLAEFAREWTRLEACLKCLGVGLQEWSLALERQVDACHHFELELPAGLCGAVASARFEHQNA